MIGNLTFVAASYNHTPRENCYALIERETQEIPLSLIKNPEKVCIKQFSKHIV